MSNLMNKVMGAKVEPQRKLYFGDCEWTMRPVKFVQEDSKWSLVETTEDDPEADVEIEITLFPLRADGWDVRVKMLANSVKRPDWTKITLPSLKNLRVDLNGVYRKFVQAELVKAGTYTKDGERKDRYALKFNAIYESREECESAADVYFSSKKNSNGSGEAGENDKTHSPAPGDNPMKTFAVQSLPALWEASGQDRVKFEKSFHSNPTYAQVGLTMDSPEVQAVIFSGDIPF